MIEVKSIKDLAERLRKYNRSLSDSVFVYCQTSEKEAASEEYRGAIRMIRADSRNPLLVVKDEAAAKELGMKPGTFYCYYRPSYVNGFPQFVG